MMLPIGGWWSSSCAIHILCLRSTYFEVKSSKLGKKRETKLCFAHEFVTSEVSGIIVCFSK